MFKPLAIAAVFLTATVLVAEEAAPPMGPQLTWYGYAQYRLRGQLISNAYDTAGKDFTAKNYLNQIGYYLGAKVKVNDKVSMQFQAGNDWAGSEEVSVYSNNWANENDTSRVVKSYTDTVLSKRMGAKFPTKEGLYPYFHLAFAKIDFGFLYVVAGIQPMTNNGPMDLMERSLTATENKMPSYANAALIQWIVKANNSMAGLKLGAPILKSDLKLDASLFTTVSEPRTMTSASTNLSAVLAVFELPLAWRALTVIPQGVAHAPDLGNNSR